MRRAYLLAGQVRTIVAAPLLIGMFAAAPHRIVGPYGAKWAAATAPFRVPCLFGLFRAVYPLSTAVAQAAGCVYSVAGISATYAVLVVGEGIAASHWGIAGVTWAVGAATLVMYAGSARLALRVAGATWGDLLTAHAAGLYVTAVTASGGTLARLWLEPSGIDHFWLFLIVVGACAISLLLGVRFLPRSLKPHDLITILRQSLYTLPLPAQLRVALGQHIGSLTPVGQSTDA